MQKKIFSRQALVRCLIFSSTSMLLFCLGFFMLPRGMVPLVALGILALALSPTPLALLGARENKILMTLGILWASLALGMFFGLWLALAFLLGYGFLCFGLTLPLGKLEKGSESLLFCIGISIISKLLFVASSVALTGTNPYALDMNMLQNMYSGMLSGEQGGVRSREQLAQTIELVPYMFPFFIIMYSMVDSFLNYKSCEILQRKHDVKFPPLPPFGEWRFPSSFIYVFVFAFVLPFIMGDNNSRLWIMLEYNLKFIINIFFFLQGMSLVWWFFSKLAASRFFPLPLRIILVGLLSMPIFTMWVIALGLCDICFDLRNRKLKRA